MKTIRLSLSVLAGLLFIAAAPAAAQDIAVGKVVIDKETLKEAVIQVLKDDPKLVYDAYTAYQRELAELRDQQQLEYSFKNPVSIPVREGNPAKGPADAPVTILSYTDFQCPYCARSVETMADLMELYPGKLRLVFKNNPLKNHEDARDAARAALAAHRQGKFWEYRDLLYDNMSNLGDETYIKLATDLGLDLDAFNADRKSEAIAAVIEADEAEAAAHNMRSVPSFVVNGVKVRGARSVEYFGEVIERLLAEKAEETAKN